MKVLVTGGSGYLGTHVRKFFNADDLSRRSGHDLLDIDTLNEVGEYDAVVHMAARLDKSFAAAHDTFQTNVQGTINLLERVRKDAAFIFVSTKDVYGCFSGKRWSAALSLERRLRWCWRRRQGRPPRKS